MFEPKSTFAAVALMWAVAAGVATAQYTPGDVVATDQFLMGTGWPVWGITPQGQVYTVTASLPFFGWSIAPAPDNRTLWVSGTGTQGATTARIAPDGTITKFNLDTRKLFCGIDADDAGNAILTNGADPQILKYDGTAFSTLYAGAPFQTVHGSGVDLASGDLVVFDSGGANGILRATLAGARAVTTVITSVLPSFVGAGFHHEPRTGHLIGAWSTGGRLGPIYTAVYRLKLGARTLTTLRTGASIGVPSSIDRDPRDGQYVIATVAAPAAVLRFDARRNIVTTIAALAGRRPHAATVAGSRHLCPLGEAKPGRNYRLLVSSPNEPGAFYIVALSLGFRPGLPVTPTRRIYLVADPLFFFSLTNSGIFSKFQGVLGATGEAVATVTLPRAPNLPGMRFFAAAVTVVNGRISVISDPIGVTIRSERVPATRVRSTVRSRRARRRRRR